MELAPIVLFAYNRPQHLRKTLKSLQENPLAAKSRIYFFSDAPKTALDAIVVKEVREIIRLASGFDKIEIVEQTSNKGLADSVIDGVTQVMALHKKAIIMEDDLMVSSNFLNYHNDSLIKYQANPQVFSIAGYMPPIHIPSNVSGDVFLLPRCSSWGWATWEDRWLKADWQVKSFQDFLKNKEQRKYFEAGGNDVTAMLVKQQLGIIHSWAIRWNYAHLQNHAYCLYPRFTKVVNIGTDGSGTNFPKLAKKYITIIQEQGYQLPENPVYDSDGVVVKNFKNFYQLSLYRKVINYFKYKIW